MELLYISIKIHETFSWNVKNKEVDSSKMKSMEFSVKYFPFGKVEIYCVNIYKTFRKLFILCLFVLLAYS